jgi:hypothetical protein
VSELYEGKEVNESSFSRYVSLIYLNIGI